VPNQCRKSKVNVLLCERLNAMAAMAQPGTSTSPISGTATHLKWFMGNGDYFLIRSDRAGKSRRAAATAPSFSTAEDAITRSHCAGSRTEQLSVPALGEQRPAPQARPSNGRCTTPRPRTPGRAARRARFLGLLLADLQLCLPSGVRLFRILIRVAKAQGPAFRDWITANAAPPWSSRSHRAAA
jgi:hypothetical protein